MSDRCPQTIYTTAYSVYYAVDNGNIWKDSKDVREISPVCASATPVELCFTYVPFDS
jgi:hypothetical protein